jgi:mobilome CxxCx(11)CxxC protein
MSSTPDPKQQATRLREARVRAYQTYIIFRDGRLANHGLKILMFLGIAVPVLVGGIITSIFVDSRPPYALLATAGLIGTVQVVASVWALVDKWEEKASLSVETTAQFRDICTQLDTLYPDARGVYDEEKLGKLELASYGGRYADDMVRVSERVRERARKKAEQRFPAST